MCGNSTATSRFRALGNIKSSFESFYQRSAHVAQRLNNEDGIDDDQLHTSQRGLRVEPSTNPDWNEC